MKQVSRFTPVVAAALLLLAAGNADAWRKSEGGGSSSSSRSKQPVTGYITKRCKTAACEKKHPSGEYSIPMRKKKS